MRELGLGLVGCAMAFGWYVTSGNMPVDNVYAFSVADAQNRLMTASLVKGEGPFGRLDVTVSKPTANHVRWMASGAHASAYCDATIEAVEDKKVRVTNSCIGGSGASDGAAAGTVDEMQRVRFNEFVDSTLDGRPYDKEKIKAAMMAVSAKNMPSMMAGAIKMDMDMRKMEREYKAEEKSKAAAAAANPHKPSPNYSGGVQQKFGEATSMGTPSAMGQPSASAGSPTFGQPTQ